MLSYRHGFHAGNFADVIKHNVLVALLDYMGKKDKPYTYIDTHAGAGVYDLTSEQAQKTGECRDILALVAANPLVMQPYLDCVRSYNTSTELQYYPGSPCLAVDRLRHNDRAVLFELHPQEKVSLHERFKRDRRVNVRCEDGLAGMVSLLPAPSRRALICIDPSYEVKTEYGDVVQAMIKAHRRMANAVIALWYPVVDRERIIRLEQSMRDSGVRRVQLFELAVRPDQVGYGMTAAGMIVINPPWTLFAQMNAILPVLVELLGTQGAFHRCEELVGE